MRHAQVSPIGPVTDYGSSMVQWMCVRQPRYKGSHKLEWERPSASYIVDVRCLHTDSMYPSAPKKKFFLLIKLTFRASADAPSSRQNRVARRHCSRPPFTSVYWKVKEAYYCGEMDARRATFVDWGSYRGIHAVEWHCIQL
jgi:hypothetical protein